MRENLARILDSMHSAAREALITQGDPWNYCDTIEAHETGTWVVHDGTMPRIQMTSNELAGMLLTSRELGALYTEAEPLGASCSSETDHATRTVVEVGVGAINTVLRQVR